MSPTGDKIRNVNVNVIYIVLEMDRRWLLFFLETESDEYIDSQLC